MFGENVKSLRLFLTEIVKHIQFCVPEVSRGEGKGHYIEKTTRKIKKKKKTDRSNASTTQNSLPQITIDVDGYSEISDDQTLADRKKKKIHSCIDFTMVCVFFISFFFLCLLNNFSTRNLARIFLFFLKMSGGEFLRKNDLLLFS